MPIDHTRNKIMVVDAFIVLESNFQQISEIITDEGEDTADDNYPGTGGFCNSINFCGVNTWIFPTLLKSVSKVIR